MLSFVDVENSVNELGSLKLSRVSLTHRSIIYHFLSEMCEFILSVAQSKNNPLIHDSFTLRVKNKVKRIRDRVENADLVITSA